MNDRYEIIQLITKDQVGGVYLAEDSTLERKVDFRNFERAAGEEMLKEANDEFAKFSGKLTALQHPNLITIYDIAFDDGEAYMVTQHIGDQSLAERLEEGPLPQDCVYKMASDVLEALHAAHSSGIIHGALNTQSIRRIPRASGGHRSMVVDMGLNNLAMIIRGTTGGIVDPILMSPEVHDGSDPDERSDLFMLGQLCYTALAGGHPFAEKTVEECADLYRNDGLPPITEYVSDVQEDFIDWIRHLAKGDPEQRPANTEEAMQLLNEIKLPDPEPPIPVAKLATPTAAAAAVATAPMAVATHTQAMTAAMPTEPVPTESNASKTPIILIVSLVVMVGAVVGFLVLRDSGEDAGEEVNTSGLPAVPDGVLVHMHSAEAVESEPIDLETEGTLDWSVTTGVPVASKQKRKGDGGYISSVLNSGKFTEVAPKQHVLKFKAGEEEINSSGVTATGHKAKPGDGWEVYLRVPQKHKGPLLVTYYVLHKRCKFSIVATAPKVDKPIKFNIDDNASGKSKVLLEIPKPQSGGFYTFKVLAGEPIGDNGFVLGLGAIQVGKK